MSSEPRLVTRAEAPGLWRESVLRLSTREQLLAMREPDWERMRNYEIEHALRYELGGEWCVSELCPFNGAFCSWGERTRIGAHDL